MSSASTASRVNLRGYVLRTTGEVETMYFPAGSNLDNTTSINPIVDPNGAYLRLADDSEERFSIYFLMHNVNDEEQFKGLDPPTEINKAMLEWFPTSRFVGNIVVVKADNDENFMDLPDLDEALRQIEIEVVAYENPLTKQVTERQYFNWRLPEAEH